jgi:hypothetical protein
MRKGDWVSAEDELGHAFVGFVTATTSIKCTIYDPKRQGFMSFDKDQVVNCPVYVTEEELDELIDLALLLKDKAWFEELIKRKETIKWSS